MISGRISAFLSPKFLILLLTVCAIACNNGASPLLAADKTTHDPWDKSEIILPDQLNNLLTSPGARKPIVVCVAFEFLYKGAHIPGAKFLGPGRDAKAIEALKKWAGGIARDRDVILYCGCCPMKECPNIRPAYKALHQMGMTRLKILNLENSFARDWVDKGYPVEKGSGD